jgi:hypothetical protein
MTGLALLASNLAALAFLSPLLAAVHCQRAPAACRSDLIIVPPPDPAAWGMILENRALIRVTLVRLD